MKSILRFLFKEVLCPHKRSHSHLYANVRLQKEGAGLAAGPQPTVLQE